MALGYWQSEAGLTPNSLFSRRWFSAWEKFLCRGSLFLESKSFLFFAGSDLSWHLLPWPGTQVVYSIKYYTNGEFWLWFGVQNIFYLFLTSRVLPWWPFYKAKHASLPWTLGFPMWATCLMPIKPETLKIILFFYSFPLWLWEWQATEWKSTEGRTIHAIWCF